MGELAKAYNWKDSCVGESVLEEGLLWEEMKYYMQGFILSTCFSLFFHITFGCFIYFTGKADSANQFK
jgi:hypothetical protein